MNQTLPNQTNNSSSLNQSLLNEIHELIPGCYKSNSSLERLIQIALDPQLSPEYSTYIKNEYYTNHSDWFSYEMMAESVYNLFIYLNNIRKFSPIGEQINSTSVLKGLQDGKFDEEIFWPDEYKWKN